MNKVPVVILFGTILLIRLSQTLDINVKSGGYEGVVIAIHKDIPESEGPKLIENIKNTFIKASKFMFNATGQRLFFKEITIAIPESWTGNYSQNSVYTDFFSSAHIRVAPPNPEYGDAPYTLQSGECGDQGEYIHFTEKFFQDVDGWTYKVYGDAGRQLVHEWGHFRFGVFDEYGSVGDRRFPLFYLDNGKVSPSSCVKNIGGWTEQENGEPCIIYEGGMVGDECRFIPDMSEKGQSLQASVMYMPFLPTMGGFCTDTTADLNKKHNWRAPTKQNAFCQYKSTWDVISKHTDVTKSPQISPSTITNPSFKIIQFAGLEARRTVLVMDVSSSMSGNRIVNLGRAASRFILDNIPTDSSLGLVKFSTKAQRLAGMTKVTNETVRDLLASKVPLSTEFSTCIGCGIEMAIKILEENGEKTEGATIILISDGEENEKPNIDASQKLIEKSGVIINTIAMGGSASLKLEKLATKTGGKSFYFPDSDLSSAGLDSAFSSSIASQVDIELQPITLSETFFNLEANKPEVVRQAIIDKELGKNTIFSFKSTNVNYFTVSLKSPSNKVIQKGSPEFSESTQTQRKKFFLPTSETGKWLIVLNATSNVPVSFTVTSEVSDPTEKPIRVKSWFDNTEITFPAHAKVLSRVTRGYNIVLNATVKAHVIRPIGADVEIELRDNGAGADAIKNDGIYSGFFSSFTGNGRYAAVATVTNDGKAVLKTASAFGQGSRAPSIPKERKNKDIEPQSDFEMDKFRQVDEEIPDPQFETEPAADFSRNVDLGNFKLNDYVSNAKDNIKPSQVKDLKVQSIENIKLDDENSTKIITLVWTAAGDNLDEGTADLVQIRGSLDGTELLLKFDQMSELKDVNTTMLKAAERQTAVIILEHSLLLDNNVTKGYDIFFAMKTIDKAGNKGDLSNIAAGHIGYVAPPLIKDDISSKEVSGGGNLGVIIGCTIAAVIFVGFIIGIVAYCRKRS